MPMGRVSVVVMVTNVAGHSQAQSGQSSGAPLWTSQDTRVKSLIPSRGPQNGTDTAAVAGAAPEHIFKHQPSRLDHR